MRVLIADDEPDVRLGLKTIVDWRSLGFEICGEASNGDECLEKIRKLNPDLVLLDIRMPKMHGLECAKAARAKGWNGKIIILSGYSDFQYAQTAISCGVESYLLKPIDENELMTSVGQIREKIESQRRQSQKMSLCFEKARGTVLLDLLSGKTDCRGETRPPVNLEELGLEADCYQVVVSDGTDARGTDGLMRAAGIGKDVETVKFPGKTVSLIKGSRAVERFKNLLQKREPGESPAFLALGRVVTRPFEIFVSYREAEAVFGRKFFFGRGRFSAEQEDLPKKLAPFTFRDADIQDYVEKLFSLLQAGNLEEIGRVLAQLEQDLGAVDALPGHVADFLVNIYIQVKHRALENFGQAASGSEDDASIISRLCGKRRLYEIMDGLRDGLRQMSCGIGSATGEHVVDRMIRFIDKNYGKNLKLETLASSFGYNSAYLGKVFKAKTGECFNSYLDRVRIEKAKELLRRNDLKVYEVSQRVGYENIDYFYFKFHKYLSQSPMEYRKSMVNKEP